MIEALISHGGLLWHCFYEYDEPQEEDDTDPAIPGIATIFEAYVVGSLQNSPNLIDFIDAHTIHALEKEIEDSHADY